MEVGSPESKRTNPRAARMLGDTLNPWTSLRVYVQRAIREVRLTIWGFHSSGRRQNLMMQRHGCLHQAHQTSCTLRMTNDRFDRSYRTTLLTSARFLEQTF